MEGEWEAKDEGMDVGDGMDMENDSVPSLFSNILRGWIIYESKFV